MVKRPTVPDPSSDPTSDSHSDKRPRTDLTPEDKLIAHWKYHYPSLQAPIFEQTTSANGHGVRLRLSCPPTQPQAGDSAERTFDIPPYMKSYDEARNLVAQMAIGSGVLDLPSLLPAATPSAPSYPSPHTHSQSHQPPQEWGGQEGYSGGPPAYEVASSKMYDAAPHQQQRPWRQEYRSASSSAASSVPSTYLGGGTSSSSIYSDIPSPTHTPRTPFSPPPQATTPSTQIQGRLSDMTIDPAPSASASAASPPHDDRFAALAQPVPALNQACQKAGLPTPTYSDLSSPQGFGCTVILTLDPRSPSSPSVYDAPANFASKRLAKEAAARAAIAAGVLQRIAQASGVPMEKLVGSSGVAGGATTSGHMSAGASSAAAATGLPPPMPATATMDTAAATRVLAERCQQAGASMKDTYTELDLRQFASRRYGCTLAITLAPGDVHVYAVDTRHASKKEAKHAASQKALEEGILDAIERKKARLKGAVMPPSSTASSSSTAGTAGPAQQAPPPPQNYANPLSKLNEVCQRIPFSGASPPRYDFVDNMQTPPLFGASVSISLRADDVREFKVACEYKSKKEAKHAAALQALIQGIEGMALGRLSSQSVAGGSGQQSGQSTSLLGSQAASLPSSQAASLPTSQAASLPSSQSRSLPNSQHSSQSMSQPSSQASVGTALGSEQEASVSTADTSLEVDSRDESQNGRATSAITSKSQPSSPNPTRFLPASITPQSSPVAKVQSSPSTSNVSVLTPAPHRTDASLLPGNSSSPAQSIHSASAAASAPEQKAGVGPVYGLRDMTMYFRSFQEGHLGEQAKMVYKLVLGSQGRCRMQLSIESSQKHDIPMIEDDELFLDPEDAREHVSRQAFLRSWVSAIIRNFPDSADPPRNSAETAPAAAAAPQPSTSGETEDVDMHSIGFEHNVGESPITMLGEICQQLLGKERECRPVYDISQDRGSKKYGGTVVIPLGEQYDSKKEFRFEVAFEHHAPKVAKAAVARMAIDSGITDELMRRDNIRRGIEPLPADAAKGGQVEEGMDVDEGGKGAVEALAEYCQSKGLPPPEWKTDVIPPDSPARTARMDDDDSADEPNEDEDGVKTGSPGPSAPSPPPAPAVIKPWSVVVNQKLYRIKDAREATEAEKDRLARSVLRNLKRSTEAKGKARAA